MSMDHIELVLVLESDGRTYHCVACHLLHQVGSILSGELVFLSVLHTEALDLPLALLLEERFKFNLSDIERSLKRPRFINGKLLSAYKLSGLKDGNSDFEQKCEWFISRSAGLSALVYVFPSYKDVIKKAIIAASKK